MCDELNCHRLGLWMLSLEKASHRSILQKSRQEKSEFLLMSCPLPPLPPLITFGISSSKWIWIVSSPSGCHNYNLIKLQYRNNSDIESELGLFRRMKTSLRSSKDDHRKMNLDVKLQDLYAKALRLRDLKNYTVPFGMS